MDKRDGVDGMNERLSCIGCDHEWFGIPEYDANLDGHVKYGGWFINVDYDCPDCGLNNVVQLSVDFEFSRRMTMEMNEKEFIDIPVKQETYEWRIVRKDRLPFDYEADGDVYVERKEASE